MPELQDLLERRAAGYEPPDDLLARVRERSRRRQRTRRAGTALVVLLIAVLTVGGLSRVLTRPTVLFGQPTDVWAGRWVSIDSDGSSQTLAISAVEDGAGYDLVVDDDGASVCAGAPSTMTGTGQLDGGGLVFAAPALVCDDGSTPLPVDGSSLAEALQDYTLTHDPATDVLNDNLGVTWRRPGAAPPSRPPDGPVGGMWPQSDLEEVREAQQKADAGDPAYAWQIDPSLDAGESVGTAEIFTRYLTERLGWEQFLWGTGRMESASDDAGRMVEVPFTRCAKGQTNPLYPNDPKGRGCAPTVDERTYETVNVIAYQPLGTGPDDIWVVQRSYAEQPLRQTVPPTDAELAHLVEAFGTARLDGRGAEAHLDQTLFGAPSQPPLLYATSSGARYARFEHEVLANPVWPEGTVNVHMRLFADGDDTVVEQRFEVRRGVGGEWALGYYRSGGDDAATTENGVTAPEPYTLNFGTDEAPTGVGTVTFSRPTGWRDECCISGEGIVDFHHEVTRDAELLVVPDPLPPADGCGVGDAPASAGELIRSVRSSDAVSASARTAVQLGSISAAQVDVTLAQSPASCSDNAPILAPRPREGGTPEGLGVGPDNRSRLWVFDVPGNPAHTVAILLTAPRTDFDRMVEAARPILESFALTTE